MTIHPSDLPTGSPVKPRKPFNLWLALSIFLHVLTLAAMIAGFSILWMRTEPTVPATEAPVSPVPPLPPEDPETETPEPAEPSASEPRFNFKKKETQFSFEDPVQIEFDFANLGINKVTFQIFGEDDVKINDEFKCETKCIENNKVQIDAGQLVGKFTLRATIEGQELDLVGFNVAAPSFSVEIRPNINIRDKYVVLPGISIIALKYSDGRAVDIDSNDPIFESTEDGVIRIKADDANAPDIEGFARKEDVLEIPISNVLDSSGELYKYTVPLLAQNLLPDSFIQNSKIPLLKYHTDDAGEPQISGVTVVTDIKTFINTDDLSKNSVYFLEEIDANHALVMVIGKINKLDQNSKALFPDIEDTNIPMQYDLQENLAGQVLRTLTEPGTKFTELRNKSFKITSFVLRSEDNAYKVLLLGIIEK